MFFFFFEAPGLLPGLVEFLSDFIDFYNFLPVLLSLLPDLCDLLQMLVVLLLSFLLEENVHAH